MPISERLRNYLKCDTYFAYHSTSPAKNNGYFENAGFTADELLDDLLSTHFSSLLYECTKDPIKAVSSKNIPQISDIYAGTIGVLKILRDNGDYGMSYIDIAKCYQGTGGTNYSYTKFGENHSKLENLLDLAYMVRIGPVYVYLSDLGKALLKYSEDDQQNLIAKLILNIPVIRYIVRLAYESTVNVEVVLKEYISESTASRRAHSVRKLIHYVENVAGEEVFDWSSIE